MCVYKCEWYRGACVCVCVCTFFVVRFHCVLCFIRIVRIILMVSLFADIHAHKQNTHSQRRTYTPEKGDGFRELYFCVYFFVFFCSYQNWTNTSQRRLCVFVVVTNGNNSIIRKNV